MNERNQRVMHGRNTESGELSSNYICKTDSCKICERDSDSDNETLIGCMCDYLHMTRAKLCYTFIQTVWLFLGGHNDLNFALF